MKQLSKDPSSRTRALKAEARANEKSGASVSAITIKPISGTGGGSSGGFKKGGFKSAFKPALDDDAAATQPEIVREKSASETATTGKVRVVEMNADEESASESEEGEGMYDPHHPTGCWAGCPGGR
ncbi:hypothetical protein G7Y79_00029g063390 [Physcia stellaris]|nr:hypothetical protein G7Y79_00029g063390 [Physcia stellaris]